MIRAIIFDCFGVLYRDDKSMILDLVPEDKLGEMDDLVRASDAGLIAREDLHEGIAQLCSMPTSEITKRISDKFSRDEKMIEYSQTFHTDYKVALLSNIDSRTIRELFPDHEELFDEFVVSGDIGIVKPSPEIFTYAANKLGLLPEECVMIDDIASNVSGAQEAGMHGIVFQSLPQLKRDLGAQLDENHA